MQEVKENKTVDKTEKVEKNENVKKQEEAPVLPMEDNTREDELFSKDLQEELEAKFDELFGSVDTSKKDN